jgi:hypothetical protein
MENKLSRTVHLGIIGIFVSLYFLVATISMINSVAFFDLAHEGLMNWALAIGFELGAAASLAAIVILDRTNKTMVWALFLLLTSFQMMANSFHAFINLENYMGWIELFGLEEAEPIYQKRVLSIVSGAILPLVALGFIKSLVDYVRPERTDIPETIQPVDPIIPTEVPDMREPLGEWVDEELEIEEIEITPEVDEKPTEEDTYSRDAQKATIPAEVGEVIIAPETVEVKTENADVHQLEKPIPKEHITPVGDPIIIPTPLSTKTKAKNIINRGFLPGGESKP